MVLGMGVLAGCATTTVYKTEPEPGFKSENIHKVMIISLSKRTDVRLAVEDEFVRQWKKRGVQAVASHDALPFGTPLEKTHVAPVAKQQGFDSVLVSRLLGVQKIDPNIRNQEFDVESSSAAGKLDDYFDAVVASPQYAQNYQLAAVTANLYQVSTEKKVWSATTQTLVEQDLPKQIGEYVSVVLKTLYKSEK